MKILLETNAQDNLILRQYAEHIIETGDYKMLVADMWNTLKRTKGVGLAAPQLGVSKRIIVVNAFPNKKKSKPRSILMINPDILESSGQITSIEMCLSCPKKVVKINRFATIKIAYSDLTGAEYVGVFSNRTAAIIQHEIDHLNGKLISDYERDYKSAMKQSNTNMEFVNG